VETFAKFLEKLSTIQDGDATLLDRSMLMFGSSLSDGDMHSPLNLPTILMGGGNGTLKGNQHIVWAEEKKTPMSNLFVTLLDKVGVHVDEIGDSTGDLPELVEL
jgi:transposase